MCGGIDRDPILDASRPPGTGRRHDRAVRDVEAERMRLECVVTANLAHRGHLQLDVKFGRGVELRRCAVSSRAGTEYVEFR